MRVILHVPVILAFLAGIIISAETLNSFVISCILMVISGIMIGVMMNEGNE